MEAPKAEDIMSEVAHKISEGVSYIDALVEYAIERNMEVEVVGKIVRRNQAAMAKIREEAETLNLIEKTDRLNFD